MRADGIDKPWGPPWQAWQCAYCGHHWNSHAAASHAEPCLDCIINRIELGDGRWDHCRHFVPTPITRVGIARAWAVIAYTKLLDWLGIG
jgi:hypothetical protein